MGGLVLGLSVLLILVLYQQTTLYLGELWMEWGEGAYGHGFLVLLISAYMIYTKRGALARLTPCPSNVALIAVFACSLLWMMAALASVQLVQMAVLLPLIVSIIWAVLGSRIALELLLPVMFMCFALPLWGALLPLLQVITAEGAYWLTRVVAIPAMMQDFIVTLPSGRLSIEYACSGLNYLMAGVTLGVFYAFLNYRTFSHRLLVVMTVAGAAVLGNILRVFIIIWFAWKTDMQHPYVKDHLGLGWYLFGGLMILLLVIDHFIASRSSTSAEPPPAVGGNSGPCVHGLSRRLFTYLATLGLIVAGPTIAWQVSHGEVDVDASGLVHPAGVAGWQGPLQTNDNWMPAYQGAIEQKVLYKKGNSGVYLYSGYYPRQAQGAELINVLNSLSKTPDWQVGNSSEYHPAGLDSPVIATVLVSSAGKRRLVWYWYRIAGRYTTNAYEAKLLQAMGLLSGKPDATIIAMATDLDPGMETARVLLTDFLSIMENPLTAAVNDVSKNMDQ